MAEVSYPSPAHNTRNVTDSEYENIAGRFSDDGVNGDPTQGAVVVAGTGLQVLILAGTVASVRGHAWEAGTTDVPVTIAANATGSTRYDWVVLRLDRSTWTVRATVVQGTAGAGYPTAIRDEGSTGQWDVCLGLVTVLPSAASVTVVPATQFVGGRIRPANSTEIPFGHRIGDLQYRPDTGAWEGWNGSAWQAVYSDSGVLALGGGFSTWADEAENVGRRKGDDVYLRIWKSRTGSTFDRNDATGSKVAVLPPELVPSRYEHFPVHFSGSGGNATLQIRPDGEVWVIENDADVTPGRHLAVTCNYMID